MTEGRTADLWWKNAVIYCVEVEMFLDGDADGCGDLRGLTERIDYLAGVGVTCLWLMPFFPSPFRDDGYDVTDYYNVDHRLGSLGDFVVLLRTARNRGMRVVIDLVVNHTSNKHPWFRSARASRNSPYRDFYVWRDEPSNQPSDAPVFPDADKSIWSWDEKAGQWYLHHFYAHQPDLNIENPFVRNEIAKIGGFWLELGVDGFRVDAVPYLLEEEGNPGDVPLDPHAFLKHLQAFISRRRGDAVLLGEVNAEPKALRGYFGDAEGDEFKMLFNFPVMQAMYLALARQDARPLARTLEQLPEIPEDCQWAMFVRNHDELTLDQLSDDERHEVFEAFGPEEDMQLYGRGLRRRLPPMLDDNPQRVRLVYSLLFSLPGTPILFYGEEIGMGENLAVEGRMSVRTPMQWSNDVNAGFSKAAPSRLRRPIVEGKFGPKAVNVAEQRRDPHSLLNWMERIIRRRHETPALGWGASRVLATGDHSVLAHCTDWEGTTVVLIHNFASEPRSVRIDVGTPSCHNDLVNLLDEEDARTAVDGGCLELTLEGYGFRWFRLRV